MPSLTTIWLTSPHRFIYLIAIRDALPASQRFFKINVNPGGTLEPNRRKSDSAVSEWVRIDDECVCMMGQTLKLGVFLVLFACSHAYADAVYTWTDAVGTIHFSSSEPPENVRESSRLTYAAPKPAAESDAGPGPAAIETEASWLNALEQAKRLRKHAQETRQSAENGILTANRLKQETDEFIKPWRSKKRIKRPVLQQINDRIQAANAAIARAEALVQTANEAEQAAQRAEQEAKKAEASLFEAYRQIMND